MTTSDSAPLALGDEAPSDKPALLMMVVKALSNIQYKSLIFLFILFVLVTSDVFVEVILKKMSGTVDDAGDATPYGTVIQGLILVLAYMILNFFIDQEIL